MRNERPTTPNRRLCRPALPPLSRAAAASPPRGLPPVSPGAVTPPARRFHRHRVCVAPHYRPRAAACVARCRHPSSPAFPPLPVVCRPALPPPGLPFALPGCWRVSGREAAAFPPHPLPGPIRIDWKSPSICLFFFLSFIFFCCYFISFNFSVELSNVFFLFFLLFQWEGERKKERKKEREREREK